MPNDALFDTQTTTDAAAATGTTSTTAQADVTTTTQPQGLTADQVQSMIADQVTPLQRENDALKLAIAQAQQQPTPTAAPSGDDFVTGFNKDPLAAVREVARGESGEALKQLAPHLNVIINSANTAFLDAQRVRIESEFGTKAWAEVFQPRLKETFDAIRRENPFAIADIGRVEREVNTISGANFTKLADMRQEHIKGTGAAEQARVDKLVETVTKATGLTGGTRLSPKGGAADLSPEMRAAIADMDRVTGKKTDLTQWAKEAVAVQNSKDVADWLSNTKPAGRA